jgi:hypothetical protein
VKTASCKAKGRRLQQWVCTSISKITGLPWGPDEMIASREMGQSGCDVRLVGEAKIIFPYSIECKNTEVWALPAAIQQAKDNRQENTDWLVFLQKNRMKVPVVVLDASVFFKLCERILKHEHNRRYGEGPANPSGT